MLGELHHPLWAVQESSRCQSHRCSSLRVKSCPPKPTLYILGLFCPCGAAKGLLKCQLAARAMASAHSVPWHLPGPGSAQCLGLWDRCHGHARKTRSPGTSPCHLAPGCAHLQPRTAKLWHTSAAASSPIFFFFSSSFLLGVGRGEEGEGGSVCQCGCWVIKPCTNLCPGLPAPPSPWVERVLGTRSQAGTCPLAPAGPKPALHAGRDDSKLTEPPRQMS